jgi:pimeloyl-ACP methyl ester carboxylesterase
VRRALPALALAALVAGCGGGHHHHTGATAAAAPVRLSQPRACHGLAHVTCATLTVPLDHSGKAPGRLRLRVAMAGPAHPARGVIVFLSGGPGQPGVPFVPRIRQRLASALRGYRLVMIDQRGTGAGALRCPALQRAAGSSDLTVPPRAAVLACARRLGERRRFFTTRDTVADLEGLRTALGVRRLTLDGVSYGTFVAEHYALEHPTRVAALVLDSVVPQEGINPFQLETIHAVPRVLRSACAARHCAGDPVADLAAVVRARHDGPQLLDMLVTLSIADPSYRAVPRALSEARAGRPARLERLEAAVRRGDRAPAALLSQGLHASTLCEDYPQPWGGPGAPLAARRAAIGRAAAGLSAADLAPFDRATATGNGELLTCEEWPPLPLRVPASRQDLPRVPVLLLAGERDLSTPLAWARDELGRAPDGRLVVVPGAGHSVQLRAADPAGRRALLRFLRR